MSQYSKIAQRYNDYMSSHDTLEKFKVEFLDYANILNALQKYRVLDIGCGTGINVSYMLRSYPEIKEIVGIDNSEEMIHIAEKNISNHKSTFKLSNMQKMPFKDNYFDLIYSKLTIHYSPSLRETFSEIHRVLKKGGRLVFMDTHPIMGMYFKPSKSYFINEDATFPLSGGKSDMEVTHPTYKVSDYVTAVLNCGFSIEKFTEEKGSMSSLPLYNGCMIPTKIKMVLRKI